MAPRALIGYLVGYDSTNIFRVWVPQQNKVIRVRNATIDESKLFDPFETVFRRRTSVNSSYTSTSARNSISQRKKLPQTVRNRRIILRRIIN